MRVGAADVLVRRLVRSQCVYVTVGTTRTAMKEIALMTTLPLYSTHGCNPALPLFNLIGLIARRSKGIGSFIRPQMPATPLFT